MPPDLLLGLDVGTTSVKGVLVTPEGRIVAEQRAASTVQAPRPNWSEQDMLQNWWSHPAAVLRQLFAGSGIAAERVGAIGVSGLYPAMGPTDGSGRPLGPAILYSDNRALAEVEEINTALGLQLTSEELTPKLVWFLRHEPELARQLRMFFDAPHYLVYQLCGAYVTDTITNGLWGAIYSAPRQAWRPEVCERFGIPPAILPSIRVPAEIVGTVHARAATETGLAPGTPVISGVADLVTSLISAGVTETDESAAYYGSAGVMPVMKESLLRAVHYPYGVEDGYVFDYPCYSVAVGSAVSWFRDQLGPAGATYEQLDDLAAQAPAGSDGLVCLPFLQGQRSPVFDPWATAVYFGLRPGHTRGHLYRAVLESWGYSIRHGLDNYFHGPAPLRRLVATGGGARSRLWRQIVTDIIGMPQEYVADADGPLGAAYLAGMALGWFKDFGPLRKDWIKISAVVEPNGLAKAEYDRFYPTYVELQDALRETFARHGRRVAG